MTYFNRRSMALAVGLALLANPIGTQAQTTTTYTYDALGRLSSASETAGSHAYQYDSTGNRIQYTVSGSATAAPVTTTLAPGMGTHYIWNFRSGVDHVDLTAFHFAIDGAYMLANGAVNVDNPGTASDYCYFYLTNAGGVDNYVVFMGLLSNQLRASDFIT